MPGYEVAEGAVATIPSKTVELKVTLDKIGTIPPGMVRIQGTEI